VKILMVASECAPWAKVGGLGDVVPALAKALAAEGHQVRVCLPLYAQPNSPFPASADERAYPVLLPLRPPRRATIRVRPGPPPLDALVLVDDPALFDRPGIYVDPTTRLGYEDNGERYVGLSAAAAWAAARAPDGFAADVVHCHDHQVGLVPAFLRFGPPDLRADRAIGTVFTVHNLRHQGVFAPELFWTTGLDPWLMQPLGPLEYHGRMSMMKVGLVLSNRLTTVSPTYASEICTAALGEGLDGVLRERRGALAGILNGVDLDVWHPTIDALIPARYSAEDLSGKGTNREALLDAFALTRTGPRTPIIGMVSRLDEQKGFDLLLDAVDSLLQSDVRLVVLGDGEEVYRRGLTEAAARHAGRVGVRIGFDERLAHLVEAGSDMFLMPSRYEPCGLNQMYSLLYGTVPVVRATGGLADTVVDPEEQPRSANGFVFRAYAAAEMARAVERGVRAFGDAERWRELVLRGMRSDFSWRRSALEYLEVFRAAGADAQNG
jgi:starch synthase